MAITNKIDLTSLDFDDIKSSLKAYLLTQSEFSGYNFEGSALNILLDVLSVNTHYTAFFANMLANEMFLDTATQRDSVVSLAKLLSYTPQSKKASKITANITITPQAGHTPSLVVVPRNTVFTTTMDNQVFNYVVTENQTIYKDTDGNYIGYGIELSEGAIVQFAYEVDAENPDQKFLIPNLSVDTDSLVVKVRNSRTDSTTYTWTKSTDLYDLTSTSKVYWLQESNKSYFEVYFGDGIIGKQPSTGNIVILEYLVTNGSTANGAGTSDSTTSPALTLASGSASYTYSSTEYTTSNLVVSVVDPASGGADKESIESIKFLAPLTYAAQNRAVTAEDYKTVILQNRPSIETCTVWGGEDNTPVNLGKVYISLKPFSGSTVSELTKENITRDILATRNVVTIQPVIVDPDYTYLIINTTVKFDQTLTPLLASDITTIVYTAIKTYGDQYLEKFDRGFRFSRLSYLIDNSHTSILSNLTSVTLEKRITPITDTNSSSSSSSTSSGSSHSEEFMEILYFNNALYHPEDGYIPIVSSTSFTYGGETAYFDDDGNGNLRVYKLNGSTKVILDADAGYVDYTTGEIDILPLVIDAYDEYIAIRVVPDKEDVSVARNQILTIDPAEITVEAEPDSVTI